MSDDERLASGEMMSVSRSTSVVTALCSAESAAAAAGVMVNGRFKTRTGVGSISMSDDPDTMSDPIDVSCSPPGPSTTVPLEHPPRGCVDPVSASSLLKNDCRLSEHDPYPPRERSELVDENEANVEGLIGGGPALMFG